MYFNRHTVPNAAKAIGRVLVRLVQCRPVTVSLDEQDRRLATCYACPRHIDGQCLECSCYVSIKVILYSESCPLKKW